MADPVRIGNFFSTFDTEGVIAQLTQARQIPILKLDQQKSTAQVQKAMVGQLNASVAALLARAKALADITSVSGKSVALEGTGVNVSASSSAAAGQVTINVTQLATGTSVTGPAISAALNSASLLNASNFAVPVTAGTFTIKNTAGQATLTVDPTTQSLADVVTAINATGLGITASIQNDANGRANILQLTSASGAIVLGSGGDTSNFLAATNLIASPGTTTRASTVGIARLNPAGNMDVATFNGGPPVAGAQSFSINGVTINYNTAVDSLNSVISRINASTAGVTARYDPTTDTVKLSQGKSGSVAIALADNGAGDLLAKLGLAAAAQSLGQNAQYSIDGGATQYSDSNTVNFGGLTLTLTATTATPVKATIGQDSGSALTALRGFVTDYNSVLDAIAAATRTNGKDTSSSGALSGDVSLRSLQTTLRTMISSAGVNLSGAFKTLNDIGVSFGAYNSAVGSTNKLVLDETRFKSVLASDPVSVQGVLSQFKLDAALLPAGTGSIASISGSFGGSRAGTYAVSSDMAGTLTAVFTPIDGGPPSTTTGTIAASGTNTTLIPGMTLTGKAVLAAGSDTITVTPTNESVISRLKTFLEAQGGVGGLLAKRQATYDLRIADINKRQVQLQDGIDKEMALLRRKFTAMEQAQAAAQGVISSLQRLNPQQNN